MLFAQKVLAPGPQLKHSGNVNPVLDTGPPAKLGWAFANSSSRPMRTERMTLPAMSKTQSVFIGW
jgi:hypothetical protein